MEGSYSPLMECKESELDWKIIRHRLYQPKTSPWFDVRVFYVRFSGFEVDKSTPKHLTLKHIPLSPDTIIEVNGGRSSIYSDCVSSLLRRDRVDKKTEEATFVGTDSIRMTGSVRFEVSDDDDLLISGALDLCKSNGFTGESKDHFKKWNINCQLEMSTTAGFLKGKQHVGPEALLPTIDVYVTGCFSGTPIVLTKTLQLGLWKRHHQKMLLDSILEYESTELKRDTQPDNLQVPDECSFYHSASDLDDNLSTFYSEMKYLKGEGEELSWFNAGVRVGVGIGLGVCLGVGLGVGLLVRTYQATTRRSFKRRLI